MRSRKSQVNPHKSFGTWNNRAESKEAEKVLEKQMPGQYCKDKCFAVEVQAPTGRCNRAMPPSMKLPAYGKCTMQCLLYLNIIQLF